MASYKIVETLEEIDQVIAWCKETKYCSHDFETSGGSFANKNEYPTIIGISFQIGSAYIIPLGHSESKFKKIYPEILKKISTELFEDPEIIKIAWNFKFEEKWVMRYGVKYKGRCFDAMLAKYLLDEERPNDLGSIVARLLPDYQDYKDDTEQLARVHGWAGIPLKELCDRNALDCDLCLRLMCYFEPRLIKTGLYPLFRNLIMRGSNVLAKSEFKGIKVNTKYLDKLIAQYKIKIEDNELNMRNHIELRKYEKKIVKVKIKNLIKKVKEEILTIEDEGKPNAPRLIKSREEKVSKLAAGQFTNQKERKLMEPFNFSSPNQLIDFFYNSPHGLKFPIVRYTKNKLTKQDTDRPSTDEDTLEMLRPYDKKGFLAQLLDHRGLSKLYSTYMVGMKTHVTEDNRIHANFKIHGTVTGRLSCGDPNLQNIPRGDNEDAAKIKKMFIADRGCLLLQIDYSQAELRVMAEAANEKSMLEWFSSGKDIHLASACKKYSYDYHKAKKILDDENHKDYKIWKRRRKQAKTINFGIIYCQTAKKLALGLSESAKYNNQGEIITPAIIVSQEEAQEFLDDFNHDFPNIGKFMKSQRAKAKRNGFVKTFFGRKRRLPNIYSSENGKRAEAERQSINAPIQGTASDFAFFSSILIDEYITKHKKQKWGLEQIYTVHDSLGFLIKPKFIHEAVPIINGICENPQTQRWFGFSMKKVKMAVDFEVGHNWASLKKYNKENDYTK
jgi:DNA polymerase I-like protein with 3'-5' exonuclease and polymerase domains